MSETAIVLRAEDLSELHGIGDLLVKSGFFPDTRSVAQAAVKVLAGRELGMGPVESMAGFDVIEGKVEMSANLLAARVKAHPAYDFRVVHLTDEVCAIDFLQDDECIGTSEFSMADAERAGLANREVWKRYPRNMLYARAMSNGCAWFAPDVHFGFRVYVEGEVSGEEKAPELESPAPMGSGTAGEGATTLPAPSPAGDVEGDGRSAVPAASSARLKNPDGPATRPQLAKLMKLAQEQGWSDDERHYHADVDSFTELTKAQAHALIDAWSKLPALPPDAGWAPEGAETSEEGGTTEGGEPPSSEPELGHLWREVYERYSSDRAVLKALALATGRSWTAKGLEDATEEDLRAVLEAVPA